MAPLFMAAIFKQRAGDHSTYRSSEILMDETWHDIKLSV
jgi:hypothetical protein